VLGLFGPRRSSGRHPKEVAQRIPELVGPTTAGGFAQDDRRTPEQPGHDRPRQGIDDGPFVVVEPAEPPAVPVKLGGTDLLGQGSQPRQG